MGMISSLNPVTLVAGTIFIILFSWFLSIKHGRYHGIARFFAFESVFIMVMLNLRVWFAYPFSAIQLVSWLLLCSSLYFVIYGYVLLKSIGKPQGGNFENTTVIVKTGLYKYIRHPLYLSILLAGTGVMLKDTGTIQLILGAVNLIAVWFTARIEENEMIARFGDDYRVYMKETKMFIPFVL
jgi:protein-S-isoprenylcysteine O-methyltransferase Ste14